MIYAPRNVWVGRPSSYHELERIIFVDDDLLVFEQFEEAIVGHVLEVGVSAAAEENRQADQGEGDGDENDAAPIKAGLVPAAVFVLFLELRSGWAIEYGARIKRAKKG